MLTSPHYGHAHGASTLMLPTLSKGVVVSLDELACVAVIRGYVSQDDITSDQSGAARDHLRQPHRTPI